MMDPNAVLALVRIANAVEKQNELSERVFDLHHATPVLTPTVGDLMDRAVMSSLLREAIEAGPGDTISSSWIARARAALGDSR